VLRGTAREVREALRADWRRGEMVLVLGGMTRGSRGSRAARRLDGRNAGERGEVG
jgi:hypothetical protein